MVYFEWRWQSDFGVPILVTTGNYDHRGQTSKSLFLFFIAGISFTS